VGVILQALLLDIPETLETPRLRLRATRAGLGPIVNAAARESHEALKPWMPWAQELPTLEASEQHCRDAQAKWHAREMLDAIALAEFARSALGARRLEITSDARNAASRRVAEKAGFALEGIRRQLRRDPAGNLYDSCMYARIF